MGIGGTGTAGTTGSAGITGIGGTGGYCRFGDTGTAGGIGTSPSCPAALCGNGARDTCQTSGILNNGCLGTVTVTESCDGTDVGAFVCADVGFASGTLGCTASCRFDAAGCTECAPLDGNLLRCGDAPVGAHANYIALAATNDEVGLAWAEAGDLGPRLFFARLSPTLDLLSSIAIAEPAGPSFYPHVAVAPLPSGWVLAWSAEPQIFLQVISATGADLGRTTVTTTATSLTQIPILVARPNGSPLIVWETPGTFSLVHPDSVLHVAVVASDGKSVGTPQEMPIEELGKFSAAFVGDAFYVATIASTATNAAQLRVKRIETDGTPTTVVDTLPDVAANTVALVAGADDLRVVYAATGMGFLLQKLNSSGSALGPAVSVDLSDAPHRYNEVLPFAMGPETVALLTGASDRSIGMVRFGSGGTVVTPKHTIAQSPQLNGDRLVAAVRGSDVVAAWGPNPGQIRTVRLTP